MYSKIRRWHRLAALLLLWPLLMACTVQLGEPGALGTEELAMTEAEAEAKGLTVEQLLILAQLKDRGAAPELNNKVWLNTESFGGGPLQLTDLRGNVVIVEFWTYG